MIWIAVAVFVIISDLKLGELEKQSFRDKKVTEANKSNRINIFPASLFRSTWHDGSLPSSGQIWELHKRAVTVWPLRD